MRSERGATLVEYGLVLGVIVLILAGGIQELTQRSGAFLQSTGTEYGEGRGRRADIRLEQIQRPSKPLPTTLPSSLLTYVDKTLETPAGCLADVGSGSLGVVGCGTGSELEFSGLSEDGESLYLATDDYQMCASADASGQGAIVLAPCSAGDENQLWLQLDVAGLDVQYENRASGLCITVAAGGLVGTASCDSSPDQIITVNY